MQRSLTMAPVALAAVVAFPLAAAPLSAQRTLAPSRTCDSCDLDDSLAAVQREYSKVRAEYERITSKMLRQRLEAVRSQLDASRAQQEAAFSQLRSMQSMPAGWLGCTFSGSYSVTQKDGNKAVMRFDDYPTVEAVDPGSPAEKAGIQAGDKLLALDGNDLTEGSPPFSELLRPGAKLNVKVKRGERTKALHVTVGKRPRSYASDWGDWEVAPAPAMAPEPPSPAAAPWPSAMPSPEALSAAVTVRAMPSLPAFAPSGEGWSMAFSGGPMFVRGLEGGVIAGAQVQRVNELSDYFDVDDGLLVLHVIPGTPAARAGLRAGDVIRRVGDRTITTPTSLQRALAASDSREAKLDIVRKGKKQAVDLKWDR